MPDHASELAAVLAYYDLFDYPLTLAELQRFVPKRDAGETRHALQQLLRAGAVFRSGDFYALRDDPGLARRRLVANHRAEPLLARAEKLSRALVRFPFVRAVLISGSLSKGCAAPGADIDYFIITAPGRLWTVGHSTHPIDELIALLRRPGITRVADVRRFPGSRKHPQFNPDALARARLPRE